MCIATLRLAYKQMQTNYSTLAESCPIFSINRFIVNLSDVSGYGSPGEGPWSKTGRGSHLNVILRERTGKGERRESRGSVGNKRNQIGLGHERETVVVDLVVLKVLL